MIVSVHAGTTALSTCPHCILAAYFYHRMAKKDPPPLNPPIRYICAEDPQNINIPQADSQYGMAAANTPEFRGSVGTSIPCIIDPSRDRESDVRMVGPEAVSKLLEQGT